LTGNNLNNTITGNSGNDTLAAGTGNDTLIAGFGVATLVGGAGNDTFVVNNIADVVQAKSTGANVNTIISSVNYVAPSNVQTITGSGTRNLALTGNTLNNVINANSGSDSLIGGSGNSVLEGGAGNDHLTEASGNGLLLGGGGADVITGGAGRSFMAGGAGNDTLTTGSGSNIIAFNKGDGQDAITAAAGTNNTMSLGGNFAYADLNFQKSGNNLILNMGATEHITLQNWYAGSNKVTNLQVIDAAMSDFKHGSTDALRNSNEKNFNFQALVTSFNQALTANPKLSNWALTNALLTDHLSSSDTTALGGDLAYSYGTRGSLTGMNVATAQSELSSAQFATAPQTLHPWGSVSGAAAQIR
jgi:Ca2+-binding RTX toxin-like protein